jgi:hypothetical protein
MPLPSNIPNTFSILEIALRLRSDCPSFSRNVGGGMEFDANSITVEEPDKQIPYAFVVPIDIVGGNINRQGCYQSRTAIMGIIVCADGRAHKSKAKGNNPVGSVQGLIPLTAEIEHCLLTWKPTAFLLDDNPPTFERWHPLGAEGDRVWVMLEYSIPFRFFHIAYGGPAVASDERFNNLYPDFSAENITRLFTHYRENEYNTTSVGGQFWWDTIPLPQPEPSEEDLNAFENSADLTPITDAVRMAIEERRLGALGSVYQEP